MTANFTGGSTCRLVGAFVCVAVVAWALRVVPTVTTAQGRSCDELLTPGLVGNLTVTTAQVNAATAVPPVPSHCEVVGRIDERTGEDGKPYAIGFRLRLPTAWNGRFLFQGGGGTDGNLGNALGSTGVGQTTNALSLGYAVVSTDAGHANERVPFVGGTLFGLERFRRSDGKLIIYHGAADPVFSLNDTIRAYGPALNGAPDTARLFVVPGMNHCAGGPATDQFDVLTPLIRWVEDGVPPDSIPGTANPGSPWPGRTRPLCPYPRVATYIGSGDAEDAANFVCAAPAR